MARSLRPDRLARVTAVPGAVTAHPPKLPSVHEPLAGLADYFQSSSVVPDEDLVLLTAAARAGSSRCEAIAAACGVQTHEDTAGVVCQPSGIIPGTAARLLFRASQYSAESSLAAAATRH
jgi:hypothetical protein